MEISYCAPWSLAFKFSVPFQIEPPVGFRLRRHDTSRFNQAVEVSVVPLPFCDRFGARRRSDVTTFNFAPVFSCLMHCTTPGLGIAQRAFDRELSPIFIDEDQKMLRTRSPPPILLGLSLHGRRLRVLELQPVRRSARTVARPEPL